jgi:hypothetical protein
MQQTKDTLEELRDKVVCMGYVFLTQSGWQVNVCPIAEVVAEIDKAIAREETDAD